MESVITSSHTKVILRERNKLKHQFPFLLSQKREEVVHKKRLGVTAWRGTCSSFHMLFLPREIVEINVTVL